MRMIDLFSGIGGFALAAETVWRDELDIVSFCEIDSYCRKVLNKNFPTVPVHNDIKEFNGKLYKNIDIITGGFPCQDISVAGRGEGISGERSSLWFEMLRVIRDIRPRYALVENVPMLTSRGGTRVLADLAEIGYNAEWTIISARDVGARHLRKRIWIVAYSNSELRRRRRAVQQSGEDQERKLHPQKEREESYDIRSKTVRRSTVRGKERDISNSDHSGSRTSKYEVNNNRKETNERRKELSQSESSRHGTEVSDTTVKGLQRPIRKEYEGVRERPAKRSGEVSDTNSRRLERSSQKQRRTGNAVGNNRKATETRLSKGTTYWKTEPNVGRVVNGLSSRVDRIKGLGNAIVPQVAVVILNKIKNGM